MRQKQTDSVSSDEPFSVEGFVKKAVIAKAAQCSLRTIDNLQARGLIPFIKLSPRCVRYHLPSVLAALRRYETKEIGHERAA